MIVTPHLNGAPPPLHKTTIASAKTVVTLGEPLELELTLTNLAPQKTEFIKPILDIDSVSFELTLLPEKDKPWIFTYTIITPSVYEHQRNKLEKITLEAMNTPNSTYKTGFKIPTLKTGKWQIKAVYKGGQYPDISEPISFAVLPPRNNRDSVATPPAPKKATAETSEKSAVVKDVELVAVLETSKGKITCRFFPEMAPNTVMNFVRLAQDGFYTNHIFHRVIKGFMIQGGCPERTGRGGPGYSIPAEFGQKKHLKGTLSMARSQSNDSAGSQFYICLEPQAMLDGKYTVFGETIEGQDVVDAIGAVQTTGNRGNPPDKPLEDMVIKKITIEVR